MANLNSLNFLMVKIKELKFVFYNSVGYIILINVKETKNPKMTWDDFYIIK